MFQFKRDRFKGIGQGQVKEIFNVKVEVKVKLFVQREEFC